MGVTPAIGSLLNCADAVRERAQQACCRCRPGCRSCPPPRRCIRAWRRADCTRIMSWPGPRAPRSTPRISTSIGSGLSPAKTVQAVAFRPRCTSLSGKMPPLDGGGLPAEPVMALAAGTRSAPWPKPGQQEQRAAHERRQCASRGFPSGEFSTSIRVQLAGARLLIACVAVTHVTRIMSIAAVESRMLINTEVAMSRSRLGVFARRLRLRRLLSASGCCCHRALSQPADSPRLRSRSRTAAGPSRAGLRRSGGDTGAIALPKKKDAGSDAAAARSGSAQVQESRGNAQLLARRSRFLKSPSMWVCCWRKPISLCLA